MKLSSVKQLDVTIRQKAATESTFGFHSPTINNVWGNYVEKWTRNMNFQLGQIKQNLSSHIGQKTYHKRQNLSGVHAVFSGTCYTGKKINLGKSLRTPISQRAKPAEFMQLESTGAIIHKASATFVFWYHPGNSSCILGKWFWILHLFIFMYVF